MGRRHDTLQTFSLRQTDGESPAIGKNVSWVNNTKVHLMLFLNSFTSSLAYIYQIPNPVKWAYLHYIIALFHVHWLLYKFITPV